MSTDQPASSGVSMVESAVTNDSPERDKIALFRSLFRGREDVYAKRFESKRFGPEAFLLSRYPFLKGTLDETQLVSFQKKKIKVEKITDRCGAVQAEKSIDSDCNFKDWQRLLRTPVEKSEE